MKSPGDNLRAQKLVEALFECDLSNELHERLRDWLLDIPEGGISEQILLEWIEKNIKPDGSMPRKEARARFRQIARALGIEEHELRAGGKARRKAAFRSRTVRVAASVAGILAAAGVSLLVFEGEKRPEAELCAATEVTLQAAGGEGCERFTLPDGSRVRLKNGSTLVYSSDFVSDRRVGLDGEAFFEVTGDALRPFSVSNGGLNVMVLGTKFRMTAHDDIPEAEIVLVSGSVAVELGGTRHEMPPCHRMLLDKSTLSVVDHSEVGPGTIMRITDSDLLIENVNAVEALRIVADYFGKAFVMEEGMGAEESLNIMVPRGMTVESALVSLNRLSENAKLSISGDKIYVSGK
jgi:ferric-dicitrate binding protein FerR (iron transport regulator)